MKIAIVNNTANQGYMLGKVLETKNHEVHYFFFEKKNHNILMSPKRNYHYVGLYQKIIGTGILKKKYYRIFHQYDLQILNSSYKYLNSEDCLYWWHGSDIRNENKKVELIDNNQFVSTPDLLSINPDKLKLLHRIVDLKLFNPNLLNQDLLNQFIKKCLIKENEINIGFFPSNFRLKGGYEILKSIKKYNEKSNVKIRLINPRKQVPRDQMPYYIYMCDIIIDHYSPFSPSIGLLGLEAIAMGKPVLTYIESSNAENKQLMDYVVPFPKSNELITSEIITKLLTIKNGRRYIEKYHSGEFTLKLLINNNII